MKKIEIEYKFKVENPIELFKIINGVKPKILYIQDFIYGKNDSSKIRKRVVFDGVRVEEIYQRTTLIDGEIKKTIEEDLKELPVGYVLENSYDKIRYYYKRRNYEIMVDFYTVGIFCEIEGSEKEIKEIAKSLGFKLKDNIKENIDTIYCKSTDTPKMNWGFATL